MAVRRTLVNPLLYYQGFYTVYQVFFHLVKLSALAVLEEYGGSRSVFIAIRYSEPHGGLQDY